MVTVELRDGRAVGLDRGRRAVERAHHELPLIERVEELDTGRDAVGRVQFALRHAVAYTASMSAVDIRIGA
jgi:hypothetical protein